MRKSNKYGAEQIFYNPESDQRVLKSDNKKLMCFDSIFELTVYKALVALAGRQNVVHQVPLLIKPRTSEYSAIYWRCDFRIYKPLGNPNEEYLNIEAKGMLTREFYRNIKYLELFSRNEYDKLMVIATSNIDWINRHLRGWKLPHAVGYLRTHDYCLK